MRKTVQQDDRIKEVIEQGVEMLPEIFDMLMDEAKGVHFVVNPKTPARAKPKPSSADLVCLADEVEKVCKACKQPILKSPPQVWEVWRERRDSGLLKFLMEWSAGRAKARETEQPDTTIIVQFGDIDSIDGESATLNEVKESKGSQPRREKDQLGLD